MNQTQTATKSKINSLSQEVKTLRSAVIGWLGKDSEGDYNPYFIKKVLQARKEQPTHQFKNKELFLQMLKH